MVLLGRILQTPHRFFFLGGGCFQTDNNLCEKVCEKLLLLKTALQWKAAYHRISGQHKWALIEGSRSKTGRGGKWGLRESILERVKGGNSLYKILKDLKAKQNPNSQTPLGPMRS